MKELICFIFLTIGLSCTIALPMYSEEDYYEFDEEEIYKIVKNFAQIENNMFDERTLEEELETSETVPSSTFGPLLQWTIVFGAFIVLCLFIAAFFCCFKHFRKNRQGQNDKIEAEKVKVAEDHENNKSQNDFYDDVGGQWTLMIFS